MPITINLLAEAHAMEELRRRDPVKRVILAGIVGVAVILTWSSLLLATKISRNGDLSREQSEVKSQASEYAQILQSRKSLEEGKVKLDALYLLATNRFLMGSLMNAMQAPIANVQLVRFRVSQNYIVQEEVKARVVDGEQITARPARSTEKIVITLNAKDTSPVSGDAVNKYRDSLSTAPYFQDLLGKGNEFRLTQRGTPQTDNDGKSYVLFTVEAYLPDKTR
jgi:hypothetical protein